MNIHRKKKIYFLGISGDILLFFHHHILTYNTVLCHPHISTSGYYGEKYNYVTQVNDVDDRQGIRSECF